MTKPKDDGGTDEWVFATRDAVYWEPDEIGIITSAHAQEDGSVSYRIDYCQGKDLGSGPRGGNGPVWREGFPKPVTKPRDVLFVAALKERTRIAELIRELGMARSNFEALRRARELLGKAP